MKPPPTAEVLDREFLTLRARLIDLAAGLDRLDRTSDPADSLADDPRRRSILRGLEILAEPGSDRAARVQEAFSLPYDERWRTTLMGGSP